MNIDLLHALSSRAIHSRPEKLVTLERALDALPPNIKAEVIDIAIAKHDNAQRFVLTLLLRDSGQKLLVESNVPAPKGAVVNLQSEGNELHWRPPSAVQQLKALVQLQQSLLTPRQTTLPDTMDVLRQWQQHLQTQNQLTRPAKQQLALINQLLSQIQNIPAQPARQSAPSIAQTVLNSGAFLEANLAHGGVAQAKVSDQKLLLMRLFRLLQTTPPMVTPFNTAANKDTTQHLSATETWISRPLSVLGSQPQTLTGKPLSSLAQQLLTANITSQWPSPAGKAPALTPLLTHSTTALPTLATTVFPAASKLGAGALHPAQSASLTVPVTAQFLIGSSASLPSTSTLPASAGADASPLKESSSLLHLMLSRFTQQPSQNQGQARSSGQISPVASQLTSAGLTVSLTPKTQHSIGLKDASWLNPQLINTTTIVSHASASPSLARDITLLPVLNAPMNTGHKITHMMDALANVAPEIPRALEVTHAQRPLVFVEYVPHSGRSFELNRGGLEPIHSVSLIPRQSLEIAGFWMPLSYLTNAMNKRPENNIDRLMRHVFGGIARIQHLQLDALAVTRDSAGNTIPAAQWQLEIPLPMGDRWQSAMLNIYRDEEAEHDDKPSRDQRETRWGMRLCFDLEPFGQLTADASLTGHRLEARMWTDGATLQQRVEEHLDHLLARLREAGLHIDAIPCQQGIAPPLKGKRSFDVETTT
ncbi:MAG TPA: flagellar hook-length control protein FliK [Pseudomonadales bacterium]|nr:flagellar hook-length control protein FliK [Pseudomonadales bacterium]